MGIDDRDPLADPRMAASSALAYLPRFLLYPLRGHAPLTILCVTLLLGLGLRGPAALFAGILGCWWAAHYAVRVIEHTSYGHARPPRLDGEALMFGQPLTLAALALPMGLIALHLQGHAVAFWTLALLAPAHWIVLATTRSPLAALHPLRLLRAIVVTGSGYVAACGLLVACALLGQGLANHLSSLLLIGIWLYLLIGACHALGFLAYQRHERLGLGVRVARPTRDAHAQVEQQRRVDALLNALRADLVAGRQAAAAERLWQAAPGPGDPRAFHEALYDGLKGLSARGLALTQAARMIGFLLDRRDLDRALWIFENALDLDARFRPESVLQLPVLAEHAWRTRQFDLLHRLFEVADRHFGKDPALRLLDGLRLRDSLDRRGDETTARRVLDRAGPLDRHPLRTELEGYARALARPGPPGRGDSADQA